MVSAFWGNAFLLVFLLPPSLLDHAEALLEDCCGFGDELALLGRTHQRAIFLDVVIGVSVVLESHCK